MVPCSDLLMEKPTRFVPLMGGNGTSLNGWQTMGPVFSPLWRGDFLSECFICPPWSRQYSGEGVRPGGISHTALLTVQGGAPAGPNREDRPRPQRCPGRMLCAPNPFRVTRDVAPGCRVW